MNKVNVVVTFLQGGRATFNDTPFLEVIKTLLSENFEKHIPIKILFPKTGKLLYFHKNIFTALIQNEISTEEAIHATQCDALCRNTEQIFDTVNNNYVDAGALWIKRGNLLHVVDDDFDIQVYYNETDFTII